MPAPRRYVDPMSATTPMTAEELLHLNLPNKRTELVKGVLVVREPAGYAHGRVAMRLALKLGAYVERTGAGELLAAETGFTLARGPDTVRAPDVAFVRRDRVPEPAPAAFPEFAPDLAVEVLSPDDRPGEVLAKVADWLGAGTRLVWVIDPRRRLARVYRADGTQAQLGEDDAVDGEDVLPGFGCRLWEIL
jgi:Uma2 family endonuclease